MSNYNFRDNFGKCGDVTSSFGTRPPSICICRMFGMDPFPSQYDASYPLIQAWIIQGNALTGGGGGVWGLQRKGILKTMLPKQQFRLSGMLR